MSINNDVDVVRERTAQDTEETAPLLQVKQQAKTQKWNCAEWLADLKSTENKCVSVTRKNLCVLYNFIYPRDIWQMIFFFFKSGEGVAIIATNLKSQFNKHILNGPNLKK